MATSKKTIFFFLILFFATLLYLNISYNKNKIHYRLLEYKKKTQIFIDRDYIDSSRSNFLNKKILLQTSRHNNKTILLLTSSSITVYRPTCSSNINKEYFTDWTLLKTNVEIKGFSCVHSGVYQRTFKSPLIFLKPGGPITSDPIFLEVKKKNQKIIILNKRL